MKSISKHSLQRTLIIYFLLIAFASLLVGIEFVVDTHGSDLKEKLLSNFEKHSRNEMEKDDVFAPIDKLRNKAILMVAIVMFVVVIVLTMFIRNITEPLQHMIDMSKKISEGDLRQSIEIDSNNQLAELGNVINEMSSNLQEIILIAKAICSSVNDFLTRTSFVPGHEALTREDINTLGQEIMHLEKEIALLSQIMEYFRFYTLEASQ